MPTDDEPRIFVTMLAEWVQSSEKSRAVFTINDPQSPFRAWLRRIAGKHYYADVLRRACMEKADFEQECAIRLLKGIAKYPDRILDPEMNDKRLAGYVGKIARNLRADNRRRTRVILVHPDESEGNDGEQRNLLDVPGMAEWQTDLVGDMSSENEMARLVMGKFEKEVLRNRPKLQKTYLAILHSYDGYADVAVARHWTAMQILTRHGKHLPEEVQQSLGEWFDGEVYENISSRVTYLKTRLRLFLEANPELLES